MKHTKLVAGAMCLICILFVAQMSRAAEVGGAPLPATLAKALEGGELDARDGWALRQTVTMQSLDEPSESAVTRWDPSKPAGQRCTVVSVTTPDAKADKMDACKEGPERLLYGELSSVLLKDASIETVSETDARAVYRFVPAGDGHGLHMSGLHIGIDEEDAQRMIGTLEVVKAGAGAPYVERVVLQLKEPAGNLLAKLKHLEIIYRFAPDTETGAKLQRNTNIDLALSVFTMFNVTTGVSVSFDEYRKVK